MLLHHPVRDLDFAVTEAINLVVPLAIFYDLLAHYAVIGNVQAVLVLRQLAHEIGHEISTEKFAAAKAAIAARRNICFSRELLAD